MKKREIRNTLVLGAFVLIGTALFLVAVFFVGNNETLFQRSFHLYAEFRDAGGLQEGDNVWLSGVKVGTIATVDITDDTTVHVGVRVKKKYKDFIKDDVVASLGRDGIMGNRILILKNRGSAVNAEEEQVIATASGDDTSDLMEMLRRAGTNIETATDNIKNITKDVESGKGIVGELLTNERWKHHFGRILTQIEITSNNTATISGDLSDITRGLKGNQSGVISTLVMDTTFSRIYSHSLVNIQVASENIAHVTGDLKGAIDRLNSKDNAVAVLFSDTTFANDLKKTPKLLNEDLKAAQHNFLLRGYFRKKKKK